MTQLKRNLIFSLLASAGVVATGYLAAAAAPKVRDETESFHATSVVGETNCERLLRGAYPYRHYIPAVLIGGGTIALIGTNCWLSARYEKMLLGACISAGQMFDRYTEKVKNAYGPEVHEKFMEEVRAEMADEVDIWTPGFWGSEGLSFYGLGSPDRKRVFCDAYSGRYFVSTIERVLQAEYHLNRNYALGGAVSLNEFYEFLGIEKHPQGDMLVWDMSNDIMWIDFSHQLAHEKGQEVLMIYMGFLPEEMEEEQ